MWVDALLFARIKKVDNPGVERLSADNVTLVLVPASMTRRACEGLVPRGSPSIDSVTESVKPLLAVTDILSGALVAPSTTTAEEGNTAKEKSACPDGRAARFPGTRNVAIKTRATT